MLSNSISVGVALGEGSKRVGPISNSPVRFVIIDNKVLVISDHVDTHRPQQTLKSLYLLTKPQLSTLTLLVCECMCVYVCVRVYACVCV